MRSIIRIRLLIAHLKHSLLDSTQICEKTNGYTNATMKSNDDLDVL